MNTPELTISSAAETISRSLACGNHPIVEFKVGIEDKEMYAEAGMRASIVSMQVDRADGLITIKFNFAGFESINFPLESSNYYDKNGNPTLTARAAGFYKEQENVYFDSTELVDELFSFVDNDRTPLMAEFAALNASSSQSYVSWLEDQVLALRAR